MSAEQCPPDDGELENLLHPSLVEERTIIVAGQDRIAELTQEVQRLIVNKIIPGVESRRKDLGNFTVTLKNRFRPAKDKMILLKEPFTKDEEEFYLLISPMGFIKCAEDSCSEDFAATLLDKFGEKPKSYTVSRSQFSINCGREGELKHWIGFAIIEKISYSDGIALVQQRLRELERLTIQEAQQFDEQSHPWERALNSGISDLENFAAMIPPTPSPMARFRNVIGKAKK